MSHQTMIVQLPRPVREPRGAEAAAIAVDLIRRAKNALARVGTSLWRALEAEGRRRAMHEMRLRGRSLEELQALGDPVLEAAQVREMAAMYDRTDPGFAADLRAAAYRHEALHEAQINKARTAKA